MIEKTVLDYLNEILDVPAYMESPEEPPESYVLIEKTGGGEEDCIYWATLVIQSYAESLYRAAELNEKVKKAMADAIAIDEICNVGLNSNYNYTDATTKKYRYQAVFNIYHY